tara:strand:- start:3130 stop:3384 length:255 start_codon:yes stop_codon:yes gene_type:complete
MPWQALTERYSTNKPQQQAQAYAPPVEEEDDEWYETLFKVIPFADTVYDLGDKLFGSDEKKKKKKKGGAEEVAGAVGNIFSMFS